MEHSGNTIILSRSNHPGRYPAETEQIEEIVDGESLQDFLNERVETARRNCGKAACGLSARCEPTVHTHWEPHQMAGGPDTEVNDPVTEVSIGCSSGTDEGCRSTVKIFSEQSISVFKTCLEAVKDTDKAAADIRTQKDTAVRKLNKKADEDIARSKKKIIKETRAKITKI